MTPESRFVSLRAVLAMSLCGVTAALGCGTILGIDDGIPKVDTSQDDALTGEGGAATEGDDAEAATSVSDSTVADSTMPSQARDDGGEASPQEASRQSDAQGDGQVDALEACTPNELFCQNRCNPGVDSCGTSWQCPNNCPTGWGCDPSGHCICSTFPGWCTNRCETTVDNCGLPINCGQCQGGLVCTNNTCGACVPETTQTACGAMQCNSATNNCNQKVNCGVMGTTGCGAGQTCMPNNTCCKLATCGARCNTAISDNCNGMISCPANNCPSGQVCYQTNCCTPASTNCNGRCGITLQD